MRGSIAGELPKTPRVLNACVTDRQPARGSATPWPDACWRRICSWRSGSERKVADQTLTTALLGCGGRAKVLEARHVSHVRLPVDYSARAASTIHWMTRYVTSATYQKAMACGGAVLSLCRSSTSVFQVVLSFWPSGATRKSEKTFIPNGSCRYFVQARPVFRPGCIP